MTVILVAFLVALSGATANLYMWTRDGEFISLLGAAICGGCAVWALMLAGRYRG